MKKFAKLYLVLCWAFFIFILISFPMQRAGEFRKISFPDKAVHFIVFGVFAYLIIVAGLEFKKADFFSSNSQNKQRGDFESRRGNFKILALFSFSFSFLYAIGCEYFQTFVPGRNANELDLLAGVLGIIFAVIFSFFIFYHSNPKIFLHVCCAGCGTYVAQTIKEDYDVILYFYNPNIYTKDEHDKRLKEVKKIAKKFKLEMITEKYNHRQWLKKIKGREKDPERGERCLICYRDRLEKTVQMARKRGCGHFATTLTTSPHKDAKAISQTGRDLEKKYKVQFLDQDFKKQGGFKKSACLGKKLGIYRQNYCGCEFSHSS